MKEQKLSFSIENILRNEATTDNKKSSRSSSSSPLKSSDVRENGIYLDMCLTAYHSAPHRMYTSETSYTSVPQHEYTKKVSDCCARSVVSNNSCPPTLLRSLCDGKGAEHTVVVDNAFQDKLKRMYLLFLYYYPYWDKFS